MGEGEVGCDVGLIIRKVCFEIPTGAPVVALLGIIIKEAHGWCGRPVPTPVWIYLSLNMQGNYVHSIFGKRFYCF